MVQRTSGESGDTAYASSLSEKCLLEAPPPGPALADQPSGGARNSYRRNSLNGVGRHSARPEEDKKEANAAGAATGVNLFASAEDMRAEMYQNIAKRDYDVMDYYKETGFAQKIARSSRFGNLTLVVIAINALWMGFDAECNDNKFECSEEETSCPPGCPFTHKDEAVWIIGENIFCSFFVFELLVRFLAFAKKVDAFRDQWFDFDSVLVFMMVVETWIIPPLVGGEGALSDFALLRMMRLLRLTRMVRLMRSVPELLTLFKGMRLAARSVCFTLVLLLIIMYIFGIIFKNQLTEPADIRLHRLFHNIPRSMWTLFLSGCILDNITYVAELIARESLWMAGLFIMYVMISSLMVLNMLIGILCAVVTAVAVAEREKNIISIVKAKLITVLETLDEDGNKTISKDEFDKLLQIPNACEALKELGVDVQNLLSLADHLFAGDDSEHDKKHHDLGAESKIPTQLQQSPSGAIEQSEEEEEYSMSFAEFLEMVIRLRGNNPPSVADIVELRKLIVKGQRQAFRRLHHLERGQLEMQRGIRNICNELDQQWSNVKSMGIVAGLSISESIDP
mmetsp:Transcript_107914/g.170458  ORF Transcript_107914/g.170458 Transcript_107914/m.170458 type:complete len:566 (-) Transcript_107914:81-1778(-)